MTQRISLPILLLTSLACTAEQTTTWLAAPEYNASVGAKIGIDGDDRTVSGIDTQLSLPYYSLLTLEWSKSNAQTDTEFDFNNYYTHISSDPIATWSVALAYEYNGDNQVIEIEDITGSLQYYPGNWLFNIGYIKGEITSFVRPELRDLGVLATTSATVDRDGYRISADYYTGAWSWRLEAERINYSVDLSKVKTSRLLRRALNQQTLSQIFSLIDWQVHGNVSYNWVKSSLDIGITHYQLAVENDQATNFYGSVNYQLNDSMSVATTLADSLDNSLLYTEFSARYQW